MCLRVAAINLHSFADVPVESVVGYKVLQARNNHCNILLSYHSTSQSNYNSNAVWYYIRSNHDAYSTTALF